MKNFDGYILDQESGIKSRSIYGSSSSGSKTTLDIRGMGAQAKSNVLILINGQRLNNNQLAQSLFVTNNIIPHSFGS